LRFYRRASRKGTASIASGVGASDALAATISVAALGVLIEDFFVAAVPV
jgi:hypothetical protein